MEEARVGAGKEGGGGIRVVNELVNARGHKRGDGQ